MTQNFFGFGLLDEENVLVEVVLQLLVRVVDQQLLEAVRQHADDEAEQAHRALTQVRSRLQSLEELDSSNEGFGDGSKAALEWAKASGAGELLALADAYEVSSELDSVIEGWLENRLESLVAVNAKVAVGALIGCVVFFATRHTRYTLATAAITSLVLLSFNQAGDGFVLILPRLLDTVAGSVIAGLAGGGYYLAPRFEKEAPKVTFTPDTGVIGMGQMEILISDPGTGLKSVTATLAAGGTEQTLASEQFTQPAAEKKIDALPRASGAGARLTSTSVSSAASSSERVNRPIVSKVSAANFRPSRLNVL